MKVTVLFLAHFIEDSVILKYEKLWSELSKVYDLYWVLHTDNGIDYQSLLDRNINIFTFNLDQLNKLNYSPISERLYGSEHFIMEYFFHQHPEYEYYWGIEYDVIFTGNWNVLFNAFKNSDADLLSSHIEIYEDGVNSQWDWWNVISFAEEDKVEKEKLVKSFNTIYRISARALRFLDEYLQKDNNGDFYELIMATPLYHHGFKLIDFGGTGKFVQKGFRNRFYVRGRGVHNGTMRWGPDFFEEEIRALEAKNKLFHPLKKEFYPA